MLPSSSHQSLNLGLDLRQSPKRSVLDTIVDPQRPSDGSLSPSRSDVVEAPCDESWTDQPAGGAEEQLSGWTENEGKIEELGFGHARYR